MDGGAFGGVRGRREGVVVLERGASLLALREDVADPLELVDDGEVDGLDLRALGL